MNATESVDVGARAAAKLLLRAAVRGELVISAIRAGFAAVLLVRVIVIAPWHSWRTSLDVAVLGATVVFSIWVLHLGRRAALTQRVLLTSTLADVVVCTLSLLTNVLWPWPGYPGLLRLPDFSAFLLVATAGGFRLSLRGALLGGGASLVGAAGLLVVDVMLNAIPASSLFLDGALFFAVLVAFVAVAVGFAGRTSSLVIQAAGEAARVERSRARLGMVLREHHHVRTLLSAAVLRTEHVRQLATATPIETQAKELVEDLLRVRAAIERVKLDTVSELQAASSLEPASVVDCVLSAARDSRLHFPKLSVRVDGVSGRPRAWVLGGASALERLMFDLLVNCAEGDGRRGALEAVVDISVADGHVVVSVTDDGPGFGTDRRPGRERFTSKSEGSGVGLVLARDVVEASGGRLVIGDHEGGGARVVVELAASPPRPSAGWDSDALS